MGKSARGSEEITKLRAKVTAGTAPESALPCELPAMAIPEAPPGANWHFADEKRTFSERVVMLRYRWAARTAFWELPRSRKKSVKTIIFGHTHLPDRYVFPGGRVYINSGDWSGHTPHQCYCVIHRDGVVRGPFQWETAARAEFAS